MPSVPHGTTMTRAFPCLQVQIYEVEEHKIETWRGKNHGVMWVAGLMLSHRAWRWALVLWDCNRGLEDPLS